uniref:Agmatine coumaroyltransferase-2 n=2 Tax=Setaria italica TaxID=4555 RepID=K4A2X4_SETIT
MKITVNSSKAVKPATADAPRPDVVPLSVFDKVNFDTYVSVIYVFRPPTPPNAALEAGLARALAEYPEWAGRLGVDGRGNRAILLLNGEGARLVEATADVALDSVLPLSPAPEVRSLHPSEDGAEEVMLIQLTRFACGGLAVGFTAHHLVSDGRATNNFFLAWSQATRGVPVDPVPVHDRASFFKPRDPPRVEFDHSGVEFKKPEPAAAPLHSEAGNNVNDEVLVHKAHFSREFIARLKSQASPPGGRPCSTLRCVVAHLWRCITAARGLHAAGAATTSVCIAVDGRARMIHPVPDGYTGNVVLWARPTAAARDLVARPLRHAVELINRELARVDGSYFGSFVDFATSGAVEAEGLVPVADAAEMVLSPNIEVDSWLRIPFYDLDFGGSRPCFFMPSYLPVEGLLILVPSYYRDGSIDAYVTLFSRHMDAFKTLLVNGPTASVPIEIGPDTNTTGKITS